MAEEAGVPRRYHQSVPVDLERAERLRRQGLTLEQVAKRLGVGRTTLVKARRAAGVDHEGTAARTCIGRRPRGTITAH